MQKKLIALAIASAFSVPAFADTANVTVYGTAHVSLDANSGNGQNATGTKNGLNLTSSSSNLGFKGAEELTGGLKAVFQWETEINAAGGSALTATQRDSYIGVAGGFGTVVAGRLPLGNQYANDANFFGAKVGDAGNFVAAGLSGVNSALLSVPSRISRAIGYVSPSFGGVTVTVGYVPNTPQSYTNNATNSQNNQGKSSSYTLRAAYDNNGIFGAVNYLNISAAGLSPSATAAAGIPGAALGGGLSNTAVGAKINILSLAGGYDFGVAKVRAQYVNTAANAPAAAAVGMTKFEQSVITVGGQFNIGESDAVKASVAKAMDAKESGVNAANTGATMVVVGYDHNMSKRTTVYAAYAKVSNGSNANFGATGYAHGGVGAPVAAAGGLSYSPSALSVGIIHKF